MRIRVALGLLLAVTACDKEPSAGSSAAATLEASTPQLPASSAPSSPPEPPQAPDIVVDGANVSVGSDRVATGEPALADKVATFVAGRPMIAGQTVSVVALRGSRPSAVAAVVTALRRAKATAVVVRTEARDGTTQKLPVTLSTASADCAAVAWIAKDAAIAVWPAGGGTARRILKGLAGPDMTLGSEAVLKQESSCAAPVVFTGAEDNLTWGLVFDLATASLSGASAKASSVVLVTGAVPGRKLVFSE